MAMICEVVNQTTNQCEQWSNYTPVIPDLTVEQVGIVWASFLIAMLISWGFKKVIHLFGVW